MQSHKTSHSTHSLWRSSLVTVWRLCEAVELHLQVFMLFCPASIISSYLEKSLKTVVQPFSPLSLLEPQSNWSQFSPAHYIVIVTTLSRIDCDRNMWTWTSLCLYLICLFVKRITIRVSIIKQDRQDDGSLRPRFCCLMSNRTEDLTACLVLHENLERKIKCLTEGTFNFYREAVLCLKYQLQELIFMFVLVLIYWHFEPKEHLNVTCC